VNSDQIKEKLLQIRDTDEYFEVVLSGKKSKKVNGLYKSESRELVLHNKNFSSDNELMYTAIHEYAHHLQFTSSPVPISIKAHTGEFWSLFHGLLYDGERQGIYTNPFDVIGDFDELTRRIREKILSVNGELMKELGDLLIQAQKLCEKHRTSFTDYLDRVLRIPRTSANTIMKTKLLDIDPRLGYENMKILTRISDPHTRKEAEKALLEDMSPDMVKREYLGTINQKPTDPLQQLTAEKNRLERQIHRLQQKLEDIARKLEELQEKRREQPPYGAENRADKQAEKQGYGLPPRQNGMSSQSTG
jgi:hypothetical protein